MITQARNCYKLVIGTADDDADGRLASVQPQIGQPGLLLYTLRARAGMTSSALAMSGWLLLGHLITESCFCSPTSQCPVDTVHSPFAYEIWVNKCDPLVVLVRLNYEGVRLFSTQSTTVKEWWHYQFAAGISYSSTAWLRISQTRSPV